MAIDYQTEIVLDANDPHQLEELYRAASRAGESETFAAGMAACYQTAPDNLLYAAWHYRLQAAQGSAGPVAHLGDWPRTLIISIAAGLIFALLSLRFFDFPDNLPVLAFLVGPVGAIFLLAFLAGSDVNLRRRAWLFGIAVLGVATYAVIVAVFVAAPPYLLLMVLHLPIIAVSAVGLGVLGWSSTRQARFAFLMKCVEVLVTGGLFVLAGGFIAILTIGMFATLGITLPFDLVRALIAGGGGLITVWSVAVVYDPQRRSERQTFEQGLSHLITIMMRLLLPLVLALLVVYLAAIPFNFMQPFKQREVLIIYNALLFAVMALLLASTPVHTGTVSEAYQAWLRRGMIALATLTLLVSSYALAAIIYRTAVGGFTFNRLAVIGWNLINIGLLGLLLYRQFRVGSQRWVESVQSVFSDGAYAYVAWTLFVVIVLPWLFR